MEMRFDQWRLRCAAALAVAALLGGCDTLRSIDKPSDIALWGGDVAPKDLPPAVTGAIRSKFPGAEIYAAERERLGDKVWYDVKFRGNDGRYEARVGESGVLEKVSRLGP
jgi:hypothetical protein